jgi:hypothetical protein
MTCTNEKFIGSDYRPRRPFNGANTLPLGNLVRNGQIRIEFIGKLLTAPSRHEKGLMLDRPFFCVQKCSEKKTNSHQSVTQ